MISELTPYQFASNRPVQLIDIDGLEGGIPIEWKGEDPLTLLDHWIKSSHKQGVLNMDMAEKAKTQAIQQGRVNGDNITWETKALVYISILVWWGKQSNSWCK